MGSETIFDEQDIAWMLETLGDTDDLSDSQIEMRRDVFFKGLESNSVFIRDSTVTAISYSRDISMIAYLERSRMVESIQGIQVNMDSVLKMLNKLKDRGV